MYRNAFEEIDASTDFSSKDIGLQVKQKMADGIEQQVLEPYRRLLISPDGRLTEELLTLRGGDFEAPEPKKSKEFQKIAELLSGSTVRSPFKLGAICSFIQIFGDTPPTKRQTVSDTITNAGRNDPWIYQGAAAICTRMALEAEVNDSKHAREAWENAFRWWEKFFAAEKTAQNAYAYQLERDAAKKAICESTWFSFRMELINNIVKRCTVDYIADNNARASASCLSVLKASAVRVLAPKAYEEALAAYERSLSVSISKINNVDSGISFWEKLPVDLQSYPSVLSKIIELFAKEIDRYEQGFSKTKDIIRCWKKLNCTDNAEWEVKNSVKQFYERTARLVRECASEEDKKHLRDGAFELLVLLPEDFVVATQYDTKEEITASMFMKNQKRKGLVDGFEEVIEEHVLTSPLEDAYVSGVAVWNTIREITDDDTSDSAEFRKALTTNVLVKLQERDENSFTVSFLGAFPRGQVFNTTDFKNIGDYVDKLKGRAAVDELIEKIDKIPKMYDGASSGKSMYTLYKKAVVAIDDKEAAKGIMTRILVKLQEKGNSSFTLAFVKQFPRELTFHSSDFSNLGEFVDSIEGDAGFEEFAKLLKDFSDGGVTSSSTISDLDRLITAFTKVTEKGLKSKSAAESLKQLFTAFSNVQKNKLVECVNEYQRSFNSNAQRLGLALCARFPDSTEVGGMKVSTLTELLSLSSWEFNNRASDVIHAETRRKEAMKSGGKRFWFWVLFEGGSILPYFLLIRFGAIEKPNIALFIITMIVMFIVASAFTMDTLPGVYSSYGRTQDTPCPVILTGDHPFISTIICFAIPIAYLVLSRTIWLPEVIQ